MRGSRTEYIHWIQDVPDQKQIVGQYCRYSAEIKTGKNIKQMVNRALQFACSDPAGPVYLCAAREVLEEDMNPYQLQQEYWNPVEPAALSDIAVKTISEALVEAKEPLIITGYCGRNPAAVSELVKLADTVKGLRVLDTGGSDMCFPAHHRAWLGLRFGIDKAIETADVIVVIDCGKYGWIIYSSSVMLTVCRCSLGQHPMSPLQIGNDFPRRRGSIEAANATCIFECRCSLSSRQLHSHLPTKKICLNDWAF